MSDQTPQAPATPREFLALEKSDPRRAEALWQGLSFAQRLRLALKAQGLEREHLIILAADAQELTQALAPEEFASTVLELGPHDAGELLALCDDEQLAYLLDLTGWQGEDFAPSRYETWLPLIMEAGAERIQRWLAATDLEVLALLFAHWFTVVKYLPSQDEQEPPQDLPEFTLDGVYFIEFRQPEVAAFVGQVLVVLKSELEDRYNQVLEAMLWESAAMLAEDASRFRRGRLLDHGFPGRLEGLELWAKPAPGEADWEHLPRKADLGFPADARPRSGALLSLLPEEEALPALAAHMEPQAADSLHSELAYVANCAVAALEADPADPQAVKKAAAEGLGLVNLGLALLSRDQPGQRAAILERAPLAALARQGAQAVRALNQRAWALLRQGWLKEMPGGFLLLDAPLDRVLAGLCFSLPRCYDPSLGEERQYRAFRNPGDIAQAERYLEQAEFWPLLLFDLLGIQRQELAALARRPSEEAKLPEVKLHAALATWLARRALGLAGLVAISAPQAPQALAALQAGLKGPWQDELAASLRGLTDPGQASLAGEMLRQALACMAQDLADLKAEAVDPRFVAGLVIEA